MAFKTFWLVCTRFGFLSFSLLRRLCKKEKSRKTAQIIIGVLCLGAALVLLFADHPALFLTSSAAALLLTGHISGCVYYNTAMYFAASRYTGRLIGTGMGVAILLQFVVQNLIPQSVTFIISIILSVAFVMYFVITVQYVTHVNPRFCENGADVNCKTSDIFYTIIVK